MHTEKSLCILKTRGYGNSVKLIDILIKNSCITLIKMSLDKGGGIVTTFLKGELGQLKAGVTELNNYSKSQNFQYDISIIANFDLSIIDLDTD